MSTFDPDNEASSESRKYAVSLNNTYCHKYTPDHLITENNLYNWTSKLWNIKKWTQKCPVCNASCYQASRYKIFTVLGSLSRYENRLFLWYLIHRLFKLRISEVSIFVSINASANLVYQTFFCIFAALLSSHCQEEQV